MKAQALPDSGRINRSSIEDMRAWSDILGALQVEILVAVAAVGPWHQDVRAYLRETFCFSTREQAPEVELTIAEARRLAA
jgi:hydroxypyruvate isomerase